MKMTRATRTNVADTALPESTAIVQPALPVQPEPAQPPKLEFKSGAAASVTTVPEANVAVQVAPQSMPAGLEVTFPEPLPAFATVRLGSTFLANVAVHARATLLVQ